LDQREKELIQENARIKKQLAATQEEKRMLLGRLNEIEIQLNAVASNPPPTTDLNGLAERFKKRGYSPVVLPRKLTLSCGRTGDAQRLLRIDELQFRYILFCFFTPYASRLPPLCTTCPPRLPCCVGWVRHALCDFEKGVIFLWGIYQL
jgi:hypothetical protein